MYFSNGSEHGRPTRVDSAAFGGSICKLLFRVVEPLGGMIHKIVFRDFVCCTMEPRGVDIRSPPSLRVIY